MVLGPLSDIKCHKKKSMIQKEKQKQRSDEDVVRELVSVTSRASGNYYKVFFFFRFHSKLCGHPLM